MQIHKKKLIPLTKILRRTQTPWESKLWRLLRAGRFQKLKFKRQVMIGEFIVDFCCNEKKLVIELDGGHHNEEGVEKHDLERTRYLKSQRYGVLRFWNIDVDKNIEGVLQTIEKHIK